MTTEDTTAAAAAPEATTDAALAVGTLVRYDETRFALVVGYTDPVPAREYKGDDGKVVQAEAVPNGHPLLLDLPGTPREHQSGIVKA